MALPSFDEFVKFTRYYPKNNSGFRYGIRLPNGRMLWSGDTKALREKWERWNTLQAKEGGEEK